MEKSLNLIWEFMYEPWFLQFISGSASWFSVVADVVNCYLRDSIPFFAYGSGHGTAAVLLPGFAIIW